MKSYSRPILALLVLATGVAKAETALDFYNDALADSSHSAQHELLLHLTLDDCRSFADVKDWDGFDAMIERVRRQTIPQDFDVLESELREHFGWCVDLLSSFENKDEYDEVEADWLKKSASHGSSLAQLIHHDRQEFWYFMYEEGVKRGWDIRPVEEPAAVDYDSLLKFAVAEAFDHGNDRLKQAAMSLVQGKFRRDEAEAVGIFGYQIATREQDHGINVLRASTNERPWDYLYCEYHRFCTDSRYVGKMTEHFTRREIETFITTAKFYEACIETKDWVCLGWHR